MLTTSVTTLAYAYLDTDDKHYSADTLVTCKQHVADYDNDFATVLHYA